MNFFVLYKSIYALRIFSTREKKLTLGPEESEVQDLMAN